MFQKIKHRYLIFNLFDIIFLSLFDFNDFTHTYQTSKPEKKDGHQSTITGQSVSQSGDQLIYSIRKSFYSVFRKWKIPLLYFILIFFVVFVVLLLLCKGRLFSIYKASLSLSSSSWSFADRMYCINNQQPNQTKKKNKPYYWRPYNVVSLATSHTHT